MYVYHNDQAWHAKAASVGALDDLDPFLEKGAAPIPASTQTLAAGISPKFWWDPQTRMYRFVPTNPAVGAHPQVSVEEEKKEKEKEMEKDHHHHQQHQLLLPQFHTDRSPPHSRPYPPSLLASRDYLSGSFLNG